VSPPCRDPAPSAVVLVHEEIDPSLALEPATRPGDPAPVVARPRGGEPVIVTAAADRAALEWALALTPDTTALTLGPPAAAGRVLAWAAARGARRVVRVWDDALADVDLAAAARVAAAAVRRLAPAVVLAGDRGPAGHTGMLPLLVAAHLRWPVLAGAVRLARDGDDLVAERRRAGGRREEVAAPWPAVATVVAGSVEPRYVSVRARAEAAARGHETWALADLGLTPDAVREGVRLRVAHVDWPRPRARRDATPAAARSAADRLRQLVGGGAARPGPGSRPAAAAGGGRLEGDPGAVADRILAFLTQEGFL